jgi:thiazole synthase
MEERRIMGDELQLGSHRLRSRLIVGTGKYKDLDETKRALEASGADVVTVAVRRLDLKAQGGDSLITYLQEKGYTLLPNTAGCYTVEDAVRTCRLARELGIAGLVKVEVLGDPKTLFPDVVQTLEASRILVSEGFTVLPYTNDDPITAKKLEDIGCAAVMPLAAPIGSGLGIRNPYNIEIIKQTLKVPVIVDAGVGTASDAAIAMELGCDGVLMNTAIAGAKEPVRMARAMKLAVEAGREAYLAGRIEKRLYATASSPLQGVIGSQHG